MTTDDERNRRLDFLIDESHAILREAKKTFFNGQGINRRTLAGVVLLYSGGNDSTVLAHLFRNAVTHAAHANTGIGIEETRQFVRDTCERWSIPLLERSAPEGSTYRELILDRGFPGPAQHWKMYQRLKLRAMEQVQRELLSNPYRERLIFLAGRRLTESARRTQREIPAIERRKSVVWVSPLRNWTALDMNTYRLRYPDCPRNRVSDMIHMSGECLCGAFAGKDELSEIGYWFPEMEAHIKQLEADVMATGTVPIEQCKWGWGAYRDRTTIRPKSGSMCSSCELRS